MGFLTFKSRRLDHQAHDLYGCEGKKQRIETIQSAVLYVALDEIDY